MSLEDIYQEVLLDHFRHPRCHGCVSNPDYQQQLFNPLCGDQIALSLKIKDNSISEIGFAGHGCSISQASASIMSELCKGKSVEKASELAASFRAMMRGEKNADDLPDFGDAAALEGVRRFSARVKCALLAWEALEKCIEESKSNVKD